jgi:hypothetical protein
VSPARSGARDATTGTKRLRRELWCFFFHAGASEANWAHALDTESANSGKVTCISQRSALLSNGYKYAKLFFNIHVGLAQLVCGASLRL